MYSSAAQLINFTYGISISFWVYLDASPSNNDVFFHFGEGSNGTSAPYMYLNWYNSTLRMYLYNNYYSDSVINLTPPSINKWTHIAVTFTYASHYNSYVTMKYYIDGVLKNTDTSVRGLRSRYSSNEYVYFDRLMLSLIHI